MVKAEGILAHKFHGTYHSVIALSFQDEQSARDALSTLGSDWKVGQKNANVLVWSGDRDSLESVKAKLKGYGLQSRAVLGATVRIIARVQRSIVCPIALTMVQPSR